MTCINSTAGAAAALVLAGASAVLAQPEGVLGYDCVDLGVLEGETYSEVWGINDLGWATVTSFYRGTTACVWVNGVLHVLPAPPGHKDPGISAGGGLAPTSGIIVGNANVGGDIFTKDPVVWVPGNAVFALKRLPGRSTCVCAQVNDAGVIVGGCSLPTTATKWMRNAQAIAVAAPYSVANAINNGNDIVGTYDTGLVSDRPCLWKADGTFLDIGGEPMDRIGFARDINGQGDIVYEMWPGGGVDGYLWVDGEVIALSDPGQCAGGSGVGRAINDDRVIVGDGSGADCYEGHAAIWWDDPTANFLDLNAAQLKHLLNSAVLRQAMDINNAGQIAVQGEERGYLLTPYNLNLSNPVPGIAGQVNTIQVTGLQAGQKVHLAAGFKPGAQALPNSSCLGGLLLIQNLKGVLPPATADNSGTATFVVNVPASLRGQTLRIQAYDRDNCQISHSVDWVWE